MSINFTALFYFLLLGLACCSSHTFSVSSSSSCVAATMASPSTQSAASENVHELVLPDNEDREHVTFFLKNGLQVSSSFLTWTTTQRVKYWKLSRRFSEILDDYTQVCYLISPAQTFSGRVSLWSASRQSCSVHGCESGACQWSW